MNLYIVITRVGDSDDTLRVHTTFAADPADAVKRVDAVQDFSRGVGYEDYGPFEHVSEAFAVNVSPHDATLITQIIGFLFSPEGAQQKGKPGGGQNAD